MLKRAYYENLGWPTVGPQYGTVIYAIIGKRCVFTGIARLARSTINAAEDIILAIAKKENIKISDVTFYDLQTSVTYRHSPGKFSFDRIKFSIENGEPTNLYWIPEACPRDVAEVFSCFIDKEAAVPQ